MYTKWDCGNWDTGGPIKNKEMKATSHHHRIQTKTRAQHDKQRRAKRRCLPLIFKCFSKTHIKNIKNLIEIKYSSCMANNLIFTASFFIYRSLLSLKHNTHVLISLTTSANPKILSPSPTSFRKSRRHCHWSHKPKHFVSLQFNHKTL